MPIDFTLECPLPLTRAAAHVPRRRLGRKAAVSTLHRWATRGLRGVVLETLQVGGTRCTSLEALQRFFDKLSALGAGESPSSQAGGEFRRSLDHADRELDQRWSRKGRRPLGRSDSTIAAAEQPA